MVLVMNFYSFRVLKAHFPFFFFFPPPISFVCVKQVMWIVLRRSWTFCLALTLLPLLQTLSKALHLVIPHMLRGLLSKCSLSVPNPSFKQKPCYFRRKHLSLPPPVYQQAGIWCPGCCASNAAKLLLPAAGHPSRGHFGREALRKTQVSRGSSPRPCHQSY